jgi:hypothetical protein
MSADTRPHPVDRHCDQCLHHRRRGVCARDGDIECAKCETPLDDGHIVNGHGCGDCGKALALSGGDYCYTCEIALELDEVSVGPRLQRAWDALHQPQPSLYELIREITMSQAGAR